MGLERLWEILMRNDMETPLTPAELTNLDRLICQSFLNHKERSKLREVKWAAGRLHSLLEELTATPVILPLSPLADPTPQKPPLNPGHAGPADHHEHSPQAHPSLNLAGLGRASGPPLLA